MILCRIIIFLYFSLDIVGFIFAIPSKEYLGFYIPIWFLPSLFCAEIIFYCIQKYASRISFVICIICLAVAILLSKMDFIRLPFGLDISLFSLVFIHIGYLLRKKNYINLYVVEKDYLCKIFSTIVFGLLTIFFSSINAPENHISLVHRVFNNYFIYFATAFSGSLFLIFLSSCIPNNHLFNFYGRNTIIILGFHLIAFSLIKAIQLFIFHLPLEIADYSLGVNLIYVIITFVLLIPVIILVNKYVPFLIGRKVGIL